MELKLGISQGISQGSDVCAKLRRGSFSRKLPGTVSSLQAVAFDLLMLAGTHNVKDGLIIISVRDQGSTHTLQLISMACQSKTTRLLCFAQH
jgi:hypothetical protein